MIIYWDIANQLLSNQKRIKRAGKSSKIYWMVFSRNKDISTSWRLFTDHTYTELGTLWLFNIAMENHHF